MKPMRIASVLSVYLVSVGLAFAQTSPRLLPFQGRLSDDRGTPVADGAYKIQFKLYDAPVGGNVRWDGEVHSVTVNGGLVNVLLGTKAVFADSFTFDQPLYLEITVDVNGDGVINEADPPMLPRQAIVPVIFAQDAGRLQGQRWHDFFVNTDGGNPAADPSLARAKDAQRFVGIEASSLLVDANDKATPKVQRAAMADGITSDLAIHGKLEVVPSITIKGTTSTVKNPVLALEPAAWAAAGDYAEIRFGNPAETSHTIRAEYGSGMIFDEPAGFSFRSGKVGIGTNAPAAQLDVRGDIQASGEIRAFGVVPVGSIIAWHKSATTSNSIPLALPAGWAECNGQLIDDPGSPFYNKQVPDLNGANVSISGANTKGRFLRGHSTSGELESDQSNSFKSWGVDGNGGAWSGSFPENADERDVRIYYSSSDSDRLRLWKHGRETRPVGFTVVWIMRIK